MPVSNETPLPTAGPADLSRLAETRAAPALSLYISMARAGAEKRQNAIRFKNVVKLAQQELEACKGVDADAATAPIAELFDDAWFNAASNDGLAIFRGPDGGLETFAVDAAPQELAVADDRFYLRPLAAQLRRTRRFYLLAISINAMRCLEVTPEVAETIDLPDAPESLAEARGVIEPDRAIQFHSGTAEHQPAAERPAVFHGQGAAADDTLAKKHLEDYCHQLDAALREGLSDRHTPLVIAGVDWIVTRFRKISDWPRISEVTVQGNVEHLSDQQLVDAARKTVREHDDRGRDEALSQYQQAVSAGQAASALNQVLQDAMNGRIASLLVTEDAHAWGAPPPASEDESPSSEFHEPSLHEKRQPGDVDWLEHAVVDTLRTGGRVYPLPQDQMPGDEPLAAALRY